MSESPWEVIRRAADRLEELAGNWREDNAKVEARAAKGWREPRDEGAYTWDAIAAFIADDYYDEAIGAATAWVEVLSPTVADPLAAWLREMSAEMEHRAPEWGPLLSQGAALAFAHTILGEDGESSVQ